MKLNRAIGVIDSGVGGLTVAKELIRQLPKRAHYIFRGYSTLPLWSTFSRRGAPIHVGNDGAFTRFKYQNVSYCM